MFRNKFPENYFILNSIRFYLNNNDFQSCVDENKVDVEIDGGIIIRFDVSKNVSNISKGRVICEIKAVLINPPMCAGVRVDALDRFAFDRGDYVISNYNYDSTDTRDVVLPIYITVNRLI